MLLNCLNYPKLHYRLSFCCPFPALLRHTHPQKEMDPKALLTSALEFSVFAKVSTGDNISQRVSIRNLGQIPILVHVTSNVYRVNKPLVIIAANSTAVIKCISDTPIAYARMHGSFLEHYTVATTFAGWQDLGKKAAELELIMAYTPDGLQQKFKYNKNVNGFQPIVEMASG